MRVRLSILFLLFFLTTLLQAQVSQQWVTIHDGLTEYSTMKVDKSGNTCIAFKIYRNNNYDIGVAKYNSSGVLLWSVILDSVNSDEIPADLAVNNFGDVYVTGYSGPRNSGPRAYITIKYNTQGVIEWIRYFTEPSNNLKAAAGIALDLSGNVYITGFATEPGNKFAATIKYNSSGNQLWVAKYYGTFNSSDGRAITVSNDGSIYITGTTSREVPFDTDYLTIKYNSFGIQQWVKTYSGSTPTRGEAYCLGTDVSGNVIVSGYYWTMPTDADYTTIKYSSSGAVQWVKAYNNNHYDEVKSMAIDDSSNVYLTGFSETSNGAKDIATVKYNALGQQMWSAIYNGPGDGLDIGSYVAVDKYQNVYVTGPSWGAGTYEDFATIKYNLFGNQQWLIRYNGPTSNGDYTLYVGLDTLNNVYVSGTTYDGAIYRCALVKYSQTVGINTNSSEVPSYFSLHQNFPNPFNPSTNIEFEIPKNCFIDLKIYDISGKNIHTIVSEYKPAGKYSATFNASELGTGIYFYKLETTDFTQTKKMVVIK